MSDDTQMKKVFIPQTPASDSAPAAAQKGNTVHQFPEWDLMPPAKILSRRRISR